MVCIYTYFIKNIAQFCSVQFISVAQWCPALCDPMDCSMSGPCPSPGPRVYSNLCPSSQWCNPTISSSVVSFSSRLVIAFPLQSKHILISWLQSPSAVICKPKTIKSLTVSIVSPFICHEVMGPDIMILVFWMLSFKPTLLRSDFK